MHIPRLCGRRVRVIPGLIQALARTTPLSTLSGIIRAWKVYHSLFGRSLGGRWFFVLSNARPSHDNVPSEIKQKLYRTERPLPGCSGSKQNYCLIYCIRKVSAHRRWERIKGIESWMKLKKMCFIKHYYDCTESNLANESMVMIRPTVTSPRDEWVRISAAVEGLW